MLPRRGTRSVARTQLESYETDVLLLQSIERSCEHDPQCI